MKSIYALAACMVVSTAALAQQSQPVHVENLSAVAGSTSQSPYIVGTATNTTNKQLQAVIVTFNLYDQQNTLVGNASDIVNNLRPGSTWKFKAIATTPYDHFTLTNVTAY